MRLEISGLTFVVEDPPIGRFTRHASKSAVAREAYEAGVIVGIKAARKAHEAKRNRQREDELMKFIKTPERHSDAP